MQKELSAEEVIETILAILSRYEKEDVTQLGSIPERGDVLDPVIQKLNILTENAKLARRRTTDYQGRVENVMQILLKYVLFDFSEKAEVSETGDEIDAIAMGLNTLAEELESSRETEQRQMELVNEKNEQLEVILNNAPSAVVVINEEDLIVRWNEKAEKILGWKADEAKGKPLYELVIPEQYVESHKNGLERYLRTGEGPILNKTIELTARRKDGKVIPVELGISAVKSQGKQLFIGFINDISARKSAEEKISKTNLSLETSNKELESFSYSVSHDLRAPLRAINGYTQILMKEYSENFDERGTQMMNSVLSNVKRMGQLIDDLLALSRFGRVELKRDRIDMGRITANVITELGRQTDLSKMKIKVHKLPDARADHTLVTQVMTNLLSNAVKYSSRGEKPEIEIGSLNKSEETVYYIKDNGSGFDMQFYDKLFGMFQRLHDSSEYEGTGVGLAIVKRIIDRHEGRIWAESEPGKGATFYFTLGA